MERENGSCGIGGTERVFCHCGGREMKGLLKGGRQCLVSRKRLDCFREGAKGIELERSPRGGWCLTGLSNRYWSGITSFSLSKDCCKYFYINVLAVLLPTPSLCRLLRQAHSIVLEVRLDKRGKGKAN